ncbi:pentapeptide repeat-containing protein [Streptomyces sp. YC504]|uniref:Pentapeptide repeat-containing protein n=1 Tax=Streptomyces mesophilus TaxID=1775132 RepID=A0A6G4XE21_9ACTN|nr:pentapeptide repeat-containing protein [Streptomyces mesophilus]NGO75789.1 pentapeptide repeat-containing protein [Streptomyces mesophilus]
MDTVQLAALSAGDSTAVTILGLALAVVAGAALKISRLRAGPEADDDEGKRQYTRTQRRLAAIAGLAGATAFVLLFWRGPWWFDGLHLRRTDLEGADGVVITGFRTGLVAVLAGIIAAIGLYYTREKHRLERDEFRHAQEQFAESQKQFASTLQEAQKRDRRQAELAREGQVTGRYVDAIKLLASDKLPERLGGIYALERIMHDSNRDLANIIEVLTAYIRAQEDDDHERPKPDTHAALTVVARRPEGKKHVITLGGTNLKFTILQQPSFRYAVLTVADLSDISWFGADLRSANLGTADLRRAHLEEADLMDAVLIEARLDHADLRKARLEGADLRGAHLQDANLQEADLLGAALHGADLRGADLRGAKSLDLAQLQNADLSRATKLPAAVAGNAAIQRRIEVCEQRDADRSPGGHGHSTTPAPA